MIRFPPGGEAHPHDVEWNVRVHFFLDLAPEDTPFHRRKPVLAKECWLYVFDQFGIQVVEVYADKKGVYHGVDYSQHAGKDIRPFAEGGDGVSAELALFAGQKSLKPLSSDAKTGDNLLKYFYWILSSPFQLPWGRFPHILDVGMKNTFQTWAQSKRGLRPVFPELDEMTGNPLKMLGVQCPWLHTQALNVCFKKAQEQWITRHLQNEERGHLRTLCSYVRTVEAVVGQGRFEKHVDDLIIEKDFRDEEATLNEQIVEPVAVSATRVALDGYLKSPAMVAMKDDALASPDPRAIGVYGEIKAEALDGLDGVGGDPKYGERAANDDAFVLELDLSVYEKTVQKFLVDHPEVLKSGPGYARKAAKSYWYMVKAYAAELARRAPNKFAVDLTWVGRALFGVELKYESLDVGAAAHPKLCVAAETAVDALKRKWVNNPRWNAFFVALDTLNLVIVLSDRAEGKASLHAVASAAGSFLNTSLSAVEASMGRQKIEHIFFTKKTLVEDMAKLAGQKSPYANERFGTMLRRFNTPRSIGMVGKALGGVGAVFETLNSIEKAKKADAAFDTEAKWAHWGAAAANGTTALAYFTGAVVTGIAIVTGAGLAGPLAIAALLVFGGSAADLGLKLALPSLEHDPLENWLRVCPWGCELKHRLPTFEAQAEAFYKALVGLRVTYRQSLASFDVTIETRGIEKPSHIFFELESKSDAGGPTLVIPMAPMAEVNRIGPMTYRHNEFFGSPPKEVTARVRLWLGDRFYPAAGPAVFKFPE